MEEGVRGMQDISILVASDSFKGSATSRQVNDYIEQGVRHVCPQAHVIKFPIADGGEGTMDALVSARKGQICAVQVTGPLGTAVTAHYGLIDDGRTAVIEMAEASGITLIEQTAINALCASTRGVGEVVLDALDRGVRHIYVGLGGSATSDGGMGMAKALGVRFLGADGKEVADGLAGLSELEAIDTSGVDTRICQVDFVALTDVSNPLSGRCGAVYVYGPQKGIVEDDLSIVDAWMERYGQLLRSDVHSDATEIAGAGAAGGLGAALVAFCGARVVSGIDFVLDAIGLDAAMEGVDLVITGEGRMDAQSANGKAPVGVARHAKRHGVPVIAVVGSRADDLGAVYDEGIGLVLPTVTAPMTLAECVARVATSIPLAGESALRAFLLKGQVGTQPTHA